jgi:hypothetical protein
MGGTLKNSICKILSIDWPKRLREPKFQLFSFKEGTSSVVVRANGNGIGIGM